MDRRLLHYVLDSYGTRPDDHASSSNTTELWFVPVANPDGYDFTFTDGNRLWRKNLRDNNGDGEITAGDGVDLNRNFADKWGYDNEGSSPTRRARPTAAPGPNSEPETQALDGLFAADRLRVPHQLPLGRRAAALRRRLAGQHARRPTTCIYEAMAGDDAHPAVPGYDPDISAELYTTNGETDRARAADSYGTLGFTPEMSHLRRPRRDSDPDDEWLGRGLRAATSTSPTTRR